MPHLPQSVICEAGLHPPRLAYLDPEVGVLVDEPNSLDQGRVAEHCRPGSDEHSPTQAVERLNGCAHSFREEHPNKHGTSSGKEAFTVASGIIRQGGSDRFDAGYLSTRCRGIQLRRRTRLPYTPQVRMLEEKCLLPGVGQ